ncbi:large ribosomal subunit protein cL38 [Rutidosis leptorrhynchoides]|uniref:large ribosomal subunit protein cL38 n=1 Tax=Rutidosis leptorrhynchoides TaxID=125765 RepID=UPI003A9A15C3
MSVSAIFGVKLSPNPSVGLGSYTRVPSAVVTVDNKNNNLRIGGGGGEGLIIECSSRPQKKATAHHRKTRPKKTQPWDRNRGPTVYPPLPSLPSEWSFAPATDNDSQVESSPSSSE